MSATVEHFVSQYEAVASSLPGTNVDWLNDKRAQALTSFKTLGLPTPRNERWKYTRLNALEKHQFQVKTDKSELSYEDIKPFLFEDFDGALMVFVDGHFSESLSSRCDLDAQIKSLSDVLRNDADSIKNVIATLADSNDSGFSALNTAFMGDGVYIHITQNANISQPIHVLFVATASGDEAFANIRNLVVAEAGSQARIIESNVSLTDGAYLTNTTTEVFVKDNARVEHIKIQDESLKAFHVCSVNANLERDSRFISHTLSFGGQISRYDINATIAGAGAESTSNGMYMLDGKQHADFHVTTDHASPHGNSHQFYKGILGARSRGVFNGRVHVLPDAQKTDSEQSNKNLLLSRNAEVDTKPELEIYADDVKCSHGATVGQLDTDMLFYLRARGIDEATARGLLTYGFAQDIIERITLKPVRDKLEAMLVERVPDAEHVKEMV